MNSHLEANKCIIVIELSTRIFEAMNLTTFSSSVANYLHEFSPDLFLNALLIHSVCAEKKKRTAFAADAHKDIIIHRNCNIWGQESHPINWGVLCSITSIIPEVCRSGVQLIIFVWRKPSHKWYFHVALRLDNDCVQSVRWLLLPHPSSIKHSPKICLFIEYWTPMNDLWIHRSTGWCQ